MQNADSLIVHAVSLIAHTTTDASKQHRNGLQSRINDIKPQRDYPSIRTLPPKDKYNEIYNTLWFKPYCGVHEPLFDYICDGVIVDITEARNVRFKYDAEYNYTRRRRPCKISVHNRIISFLHNMRTGKILRTAALDHNWNKTSVSDDFFHVLQKFVARFYDEWIHDMTDEQKDDCCIWPEYPTAYGTLDGSHFSRSKSVKLPDDVRRRELHGYKHNLPEVQNVQAVVSSFGVCTELAVGIPGGTNDAAASIYVCHHDRPKSILVDSGYPSTRPQFIRNDGTEIHAGYRTVIERYFGRLKTLWKIVGQRYDRGKRWHSLVMQAAFIMTNMVITFEGGLNQQ